MIRQLLPATSEDLDDEDLLRLYAPPSGDRPWVRFNFVTTADGAATHGGLSGDLGTEADKRIFALLRRHADVVLVGAGTVRAEGYDGPLVGDADRAWRRERGLAEHPGIAVVSGALDIDPEGAFIRDAPVRPVLLTTADAPESRREALAPYADVVVCGESLVEPDAAVGELAQRGHRVIHSEGGPTLFGTFQDADAVDSLCLSVSPLLAGGNSIRIATGEHEHDLRPLRIGLLLESEGALFLDYRRNGATGG